MICVDPALEETLVERRHVEPGSTQVELGRGGRLSWAAMRGLEAAARRPPERGRAAQGNAVDVPDGEPGAWRLHLLGETAELVGPSTRWQPPKTAALLLCFLTVEGATPRERLAGLLWPERPEVRARANLRQALLRLRRQAPVADGAVVALGASLWADVRDLPDDSLADLAPAALLGTLDASATPELAAWLETARQRVAARQEAVLTGRAERARALGDLGAALDAAYRWTRLRPWSERACRTVMELELARDEPTAALHAFGRLRKALADEVLAGPSDPTLALAREAARTAAGSLQHTPMPPAEPGRPWARSAEAGGWIEEGATLLRSTAAALTEPTELGNVLVELAWLEHRLGRNDEAQDCADRALRLFYESDPSAPGVAEAHFALGSLAWARGDLDDARTAWMHALERQPDGDPRAALRLRLNLALVEDGLGHQASANDHYLEGLNLARATADVVAEANILNNVASHLVDTGRCDAGITLLRRALALARRARQRVLEGYVLDSVAQASLACAPRRHGPRSAAGADAVNEPSGPPWPSAEAAAASAFNIGTETGDLRLQIEALLTLARAKSLDGAAKEAAQCARAAMERAAGAGWQPLEAAARRLLARVTTGPGA